MGPSGGGSVEEEFEDSLGDFDEAVSGGESGDGGGEEEIEILDPMGGGAAGASGEPLFEEGDLGEEGDSAENQAIAQRAESGAESSSSSSGKSGGEQGGEESGEQSGEQSGEATEAGSAQGDRKAPSGSESVAEEDVADIIPIPQDIGDGRNDDIVLRQIREAAANERDPVLREKLWDEYRRIKGSR
jgi:hypothetical protein